MHHGCTVLAESTVTLHRVLSEVRRRCLSAEIGKSGMDASNDAEPLFVEMLRLYYDDVCWPAMEQVGSELWPVNLLTQYLVGGEHFRQMAVMRCSNGTRHNPRARFRFCMR